MWVLKQFVCLSFVLVLSPGPAVHSTYPPETSESQDIAALAKEFVEALAKADFSSAGRNFDRTMKTHAPASKLEEIWKSLLASHGAFQRQRAIRTEKEPPYDVAFVTCEFEKAVIDLKIVFDSKRQIAGFFLHPSAPPGSGSYKPPGYAKPDSFQEKEVTVGAGDWVLPGTVTIPVGKGPFPAVVLVHGSGPNDRDETLYANKPFRDLAWGLATKGIAVLRYEKRTKAHAANIAALKDVTVKEETVDDALAAVSLLRKTTGIDAKKIFVLGHSLGGMLVPRIGKLDPSIAGFIVMAGSTRPLEELMVEQVTYIFSLDGTVSEEEKEQLDQIKAQAHKVKDPKLSATERLFGVPAKYWLDLRGYDPAEAARDLKQPMLILQGERDYQVTMADFERWRKSLSARKDVEFKTYPKLNHLFMEGEGKSTPSEYPRTGNVARYVLDDIAAWVKQR